MSQNFIIALFNDEDHTINTVKELVQNRVKVHEVYSPYPLHELYEVLNLKKSRLSYVAYFVAIVATIAVLGLQVLAFEFWPHNVGGKPIGLASIPGFIPVTFELTVLTSAYALAIAFFIRAKLYPTIKQCDNIPDPRVTNNMYAIAIKIQDLPFETKEWVVNFLNDKGAVEVNEQEVNL